MPEIKTEEIQPGMHIRIFQKVKEGEKERVQQLEGLVLARKHNKEPGATFTLRRVMDGIGVEWIIPIFSPLIQKVELLKASRVRRAKLYYLREKSSKQTRKKLKVLGKFGKAVIEEPVIEKAQDAPVKEIEEE
jgi:large subunit ribosomal protein L19